MMRSRGSLAIVASVVTSAAALIFIARRRRSVTRDARYDEDEIDERTIRTKDNKIFHARLVTQPIQIPTAKQLMGEEFLGEFGAIATFEGVTRNSFEGKVVAELEYEAYSSMALTKMMEIMEDASNRFSGVRKIVIIHKLGSCPAGETSLFIATLSAHRAPALNALPFLVDELKLQVPIWKLEKYSDGAESSWKENAGWDPSLVTAPHPPN